MWTKSELRKYFSFVINDKIFNHIHVSVLIENFKQFYAFSIAHLIKINKFYWHSVKLNKMELLNSKTESNQVQQNQTQNIVYRNIENYQSIQNLQYF